MKNKTKLLIAGFGIAALLFLIFYNIPKQEIVYEYSESYVQTKELPAMLDFYYYTDKEWEKKLSEQEFGEVVTKETVAWILEQTSTTEYITYDAQATPSGPSFFSFGGGKEKETISRAEWNEIYRQLLDLLDEEGAVTASDEIILKKDKDLLICSSGAYSCNLEGIDLQPMTSAEFYINKDRIVGIRSLKSKSACLSNVYVQNAEEGKLLFLTGQEQFELEIGTEDLEKVKNHVCDLLWEDGVIAKVQVKEDTIQGNLIALNENTIEIEGYGEISRREKLPVYKTYGTIEEKDLSDIVIANMKAEYVVADECIEAVLLTEPAQISKIRVLLLNEDGGMYRDEVCIGADAAYRLITKDKKVKKPKNKIVKASKLFASKDTGSIQIKTSKKGLLYLCDSSGNRISNGYQGSLEIRKYENGYTVVNELPIEQYLCAVVPSEMPVSYEPEALKAQAICARSYAYIQLGRGDYAAFGAHVDDTTNYQVYNKQKRDEKTTAAVLDTAGMVISYNGETAEAYYFSTSAGVTGDGEAWNLNEDPKYGYLRKGVVKEGGGEMDLSDEAVFAEFIANPDASLYEKEMPFFRWSAAGEYTSEETQKKIREILNARREKTPEDIVYLDEQGNEAENIRGFGNLLKLEAAKRSKCGVILQLKLTYEKGTVLAGNEYNIRMLLGSGLTMLTLADNSKRETAILPSAYTTLSASEGGIYMMSGGGYGHGIGMSQNGAQAMAKSKKSCEEILKFFFKDIEIENGDIK